jgi:hypothetical protein
VSPWPLRRVVIASGCSRPVVAVVVVAVAVDVRCGERDLQIVHSMIILCLPFARAAASVDLSVLRNGFKTNNGCCIKSDIWNLVREPHDCAFSGFSCVSKSLQDRCPMWQWWSVVGSLDQSTWR